MRQQMDRTYDHDLRLKDAGNVAASAAGGRVLDLGGPSQKAGGNEPSRVDGCVVLDVTEINVGDGDELYLISIQYSDSADFSGTIVQGQAMQLGGPAVLPKAAGRYEFGITNELNGKCYRYARLFTSVAGTTPGINFRATLYK